MLWHRPKDRRRHNAVNVAQRRPDPAERRQAMRSGHVAPARPGSWHLITPVMTVSTHAVIDDDAGRPTADRGGVFTYLGMAAGIRLVSDVVLPPGVPPHAGRGGPAAARPVPEGRLRPGAGAGRAADSRSRGVRCYGRGVRPGVVRVRRPAARRQRCARPEPGRAGRRAWPQARSSGRGRGFRGRAGWRPRRTGLLAGIPSTPVGRPRPSLVGLAAGSVVTVRFGADVPGAVLAAAA